MKHTSIGSPFPLIELKPSWVQPNAYVKLPLSFRANHEPGRCLRLAFAALNCSVGEVEGLLYPGTPEPENLSILPPPLGTPQIHTGLTGKRLHFHTPGILQEKSHLTLQDRLPNFKAQLSFPHILSFLLENVTGEMEDLTFVTIVAFYIFKTWRNSISTHVFRPICLHKSLLHTILRMLKSA